MVTAQSMHYYSVSALYGIHNPVSQSPYFNRQRLYTKSVAKLQQKNETAKCHLIFMLFFYPMLHLTFNTKITYARINSGYQPYKKIRFFLRNLVLQDRLIAYFVYPVYSWLIIGVGCIYQKNVVTLRTFN